MLRFAARSAAARAQASAAAPPRLLPAQRRGNAQQPVPRQPLHTLDSMCVGASADYLDQLYEDWTDDPESVIPEIAALFAQADATGRGEQLLQQNLRPVSTITSLRAVADGTPRALSQATRVGWLIRQWAARGHTLASIDPLALDEGLNKLRRPDVGGDAGALTPASFGFTDEDMNHVFHLGVNDKIGGLLRQTQKPMTLQQLYDRLQSAYGGHIGWEYMHIHSVEELQWLRDQIETPEEVGVVPPDPTQKKQILRWLAQSELFERFLQTKFVGAKRFGLDGCETLIPGMLSMLDRCAEHGVTNCALGMPHRGRLNMLVNVAGKNIQTLFREFAGEVFQDEEDDGFGSGDVKYHLGITEQIQLPEGRNIVISFAANPSHLECVNPVVQGKARCKQDIREFNGVTREAAQGDVMSVLLHGDAAFAGQGVCFESMGLNDLKDYSVGGTVHVVVNNQIGFTTDPISSRSTPYCTDLGRMFGAPILHVNADETEDVVRAFRFAADWRARFRKDVVIDLVCYRRYGHNETDEPMFTQPLMYQKITKQTTQLTKYGDALAKEGVVTAEEVKGLRKEINNAFKEALETAKDSGAEKAETALDGRWLESPWDGFKSPGQKARAKERTGFPKEQLEELGALLFDTTRWPEIALHRTIKRILDGRRDAVASGEGIDWGTAEALAFATLLQEGNWVRVSGQDVERATFSQRHAVVTDQSNGSKFCPLTELVAPLGGGAAKMMIHNSSLSEFGVLGFELGYASEQPNQLVMWEAQFGDFANTAQTMFDQFISSGESKWYRQNGLVVSLPHGYDGAGPEHSSGRLERFLQMSPEPEEDPEVDEVEAMQMCNWLICYPSTPAQYFHLLRRQLHRDFRKPLIVFWSKAFLRAPNVSSLDDMAGQTTFLPVLPDPSSGLVADGDVRRLILCSGQISHHLLKEREKREVRDIAIVRVEQLAPFPWRRVKDELQRYAAAEVMWVQEEPRNMGAWPHVELRIESIIDVEELGDARRQLHYTGRSAAAAPATGLKGLHDRQHQQLLDSAFA